MRNLSNKTKAVLLNHILEHKATMWGSDTEDYHYWADYLSGLSKQDLIYEIEDHKLDR